MPITYPKMIWTPDSAGITVASCFDGMSCGLLALLRAGIPVKRYYAYEIDKPAINVSRRNFPQIVQMGNIKDWRAQNWSGQKVDLLLGGSPCQGFSIAGGGLAFDDPRSKLFFEYVEFLAFLCKANPNMKFVLENVKMRKAWVDIITRYMGVEPILINSALVSGQNRERYYWTNIEEIKQPADKGTALRDVMEETVPVAYDLSEKAITYMLREVKGGRNHFDFAHHSDARKEKSAALVANFYKGVPYNVLVYQINPSKKSGGAQPHVQDRIYHSTGKSIAVTASFASRINAAYIKENNLLFRKLTPTECERLQTLPDGYTAGVSSCQRYKMIGNGWTVDTVAHILSFSKF